MQAPVSESEIMYHYWIKSLINVCHNNNLVKDAKEKYHAENNEKDILIVLLFIFKLIRKTILSNQLLYDEIQADSILRTLKNKQKMTFEKNDAWLRLRIKLQRDIKFAPKRFLSTIDMLNHIKCHPCHTSLKETKQKSSNFCMPCVFNENQVVMTTIRFDLWFCFVYISQQKKRTISKSYVSAKCNC